MAVIYDSLGNEVKPRADTVAANTSLIMSASSQVMDLQGGESCAAIYINAVTTTVYQFEGTIDGSNYFTIPVLNQQTQAFTSLISAVGVYYASVNGYKSVRLRVTTGGTVGNIFMRASLSDYMTYTTPIPTTLSVTATGAAGAAVTLTVPAAGAGLFHYFTRIIIQRFATAALTAAAAPVIVTTTNLAGSRQLSFPADAALQGTMYTEEISPSQPIKSSTANTATTIVCPVTTGIIWRVTADYYVGA